MRARRIRLQVPPLAPRSLAARRGAVFWIAGAAVIGALLATAGPLAARPPVGDGSRSSSPKALARAVLRTNDLTKSVHLVRRVLALGGVATRGHRRTYRPAATPRATLSVSPLISANIALGSFRGSTATVGSLEDLGRILRATGVRFRRGAAPGRRLRNLLAVAVRRSRARPGAPLSFNPLFLAEMARRKGAGIDIARRDYDPARLRLSALEMHVLLGWFTRGARPPRDRASSAADGPCTDLQTALDGLSHTYEGWRDWAKNRWPDFVQRYDTTVGAEIGTPTVKNIGKVLRGIGWFYDLLEMKMLYAMADVSVRSNFPHVKRRPLPGRADPLEDTFVFEAAVGLRDQNLEQYKRIVGGSEAAYREYERFRACFGALGVPLPTSLVGVFDTMKDWTVRWTVFELAPDTDFVELRELGKLPPDSFFGNPLPTIDGRFRGGIEYPVSLQGGQGFSYLYVDVLPYDHHPRGDKTVGSAVARAEVRGLTEIPVAAIAQLQAGIPKLLLDWWKTFSPPQASNEVHAVWFRPPCTPRGAQAAQTCREPVRLYMMSFAGEHGGRELSTPCDGPPGFYEETHRSTHTNTATTQPFVLPETYPPSLIGTVTTEKTMRSSASEEQRSVVTGTTSMFSGMDWDVTIPYSGSVEVWIMDGWTRTRVPARLLGRNSFSVAITGTKRSHHGCDTGAHDVTTEEWLNGILTFTRQ